MLDLHVCVLIVYFVQAFISRSILHVNDNDIDLLALNFYVDNLLY